MVLAKTIKNRRAAFWIFLPGIMQMLTTSGKLGFITTGFMFFTGSLLQLMIAEKHINIREVLKKLLNMPNG